MERCLGPRVSGRSPTTCGRSSTADDLNGLKLRVPGAPALVSLFQALGVAPARCSSGRSTRRCRPKRGGRAGEPAVSQIDTGKFYEVQKYLAQSNHVWDGFWMVANGDAWNRLPEDIREIVNTSFNEKALLQRTTSSS